MECGVRFQLSLKCKCKAASSLHVLFLPVFLYADILETNLFVILSTALCYLCSILCESVILFSCSGHYHLIIMPAWFSGSNASQTELEDAFSYYGPLTNVWVARNPPGFAFVEFEDSRDARDAVRGLDGR